MAATIAPSATCWCGSIRGIPRKIRRRTSDGNGLSESDLESLESAIDWPFETFGETLQIRENAAPVLKLERLYWGVRQTTLRLLADWTLADRAEASLARQVDAG
jgi:hypothetical protein